MGVAVDHAAALFPAAWALDLVGGRAVLGHAAVRVAQAKRVATSGGTAGSSGFIVTPDRSSTVF